MSPGYEVGTQFSSSVNGVITALRFYKAPGETGNHTLHLWTDAGVELARVTLTSAQESASGWQTAALRSPYTITANTRYRVTFNTNVQQSKTSCGLDAPVGNGALTAWGGAWGSTVGAFPTITGPCAHNFFADVVFTSPSPHAGDFNLDGSTDLIWHNGTTGNVAVWLMNGMTYRTVVNLGGMSNTDYRIGGVADFDGDGYPDIVWTNPQTGANAVWMMQGVTLRNFVALNNLPVGFRIRGTGDFNGDGHPDLLVRNENPSAAFSALWMMNGTTYVSTVNLPGLPLNFELSGAGDFDGDGSTDIVWRNTSNGNNAVWLMNGTAFGSILNLQGLPNTDYRIVAVADYNGDGKPDIVWRNRATGADAIWVMNGATISQVVDLPGLTLLDWHIEGTK